MKTFRIPHPCAPSRLSDELKAVGVLVVTIRADSVQFGEPSMYAVVVTDDAAVNATVQTQIDAHAPVGTPSRTPTAQEMENGLVEFEKL